MKRTRGIGKRLRRTCPSLVLKKNGLPKHAKSNGKICKAEKACLSMRWLRRGTTGVIEPYLRTLPSCQRMNSRGLMKRLASDIARLEMIRGSWSLLCRQRPWTIHEAGQQAMQVSTCKCSNNIFTTSSNRWCIASKTSNHINHANSNNDNTTNPTPNIIKLNNHAITVGPKGLRLQNFSLQDISLGKLWSVFTSSGMNFGIF